jgi:alcohol dehydrogenase
MNDQMVRAAVIRKPGEFELETFPRPKLGPEDLLLRTMRVGICGTDVEIYKGLLTEFKLPIVMGHEIVGEIVEAGERALELRRLRIGDKVILEASMSCNKCVYCLAGEKRHCKTAGSYGLRKSCEDPPHLWGGYAELIYVPSGATLHAIPDGVSLDAAVLITSVLANGIQWVSRIGNCRFGDTVVIQGAGPQAVACSIAAKASGARLVIMTGLSIDRNRLKLAKMFGADVTLVADECNVLEEVKAITNGQMADIVVDVSGSSNTPQLSLDLVRVAGTVVHASQMGTTIPSPLFLDSLVRKEAKFIGARSKGSEAIKRALEMTASGLYPFEKMITHRFKLGQVNEVFQMYSTADRPFKAVFQPDI